MLKTETWPISLLFSRVIRPAHKASQVTWSPNGLKKTWLKSPNGMSSTTNEGYITPYKDKGKYRPYKDKGKYRTHSWTTRRRRSRTLRRWLAPATLERWVPLVLYSFVLSQGEARLIRGQESPELAADRRLPGDRCKQQFCPGKDKIRPLVKRRIWS